MDPFLKFEVREVFLWVGGGLFALAAWLVGGLMSAGFQAAKTYVKDYLDDLKGQMHTMTASMDEFGKKLVQVIERQDSYSRENERRHDDLKKRVERLENDRLA